MKVELPEDLVREFIEESSSSGSFAARSLAQELALAIQPRGPGRPRNAYVGLAGSFSRNEPRFRSLAKRLAHGDTWAAAMKGTAREFHVSPDAIRKTLREFDAQTREKFEEFWAPFAAMRSTMREAMKLFSELRLPNADRIRELEAWLKPAP